MTKEELHKAAEEYFDKPSPFPHVDMRGNIIEFKGKREWVTIDEAIAFHLHQTKKMLEGWTDEKVKSFYTKEHFHYSVGRHYRANVDRITGAKQFRDELLKQLEQ